MEPQPTTHNPKRSGSLRFHARSRYGDTRTMINGKQAHLFARQLAAITTRNMRKLNHSDTYRVWYVFHSADYDSGRYTYTEIDNGTEVGRVVIAAGSNGKPKVVHEFHIPRKELHKDLHTSQKTKVKKSETRWKGAHS